MLPPFSGRRPRLRAQSPPGSGGNGVATQRPSRAANVESAGPCDRRWLPASRTTGAKHREQPPLARNDGVRGSSPRVGFSGLLAEPEAVTTSGLANARRRSFNPPEHVALQRQLAVLAILERAERDWLAEREPFAADEVPITVGRLEHADHLELAEHGDRYVVADGNHVVADSVRRVAADVTVGVRQLRSRLEPSELRARSSGRGERLEHPLDEPNDVDAARVAEQGGADAKRGSKGDIGSEPAHIARVGDNRDALSTAEPPTERETAIPIRGDENRLLHLADRAAAQDLLPAGGPVGQVEAQETSQVGHRAAEASAGVVPTDIHVRRGLKLRSDRSVAARHLISAGGEPEEGVAHRERLEKPLADDILDRLPEDSLQCQPDDHEPDVRVVEGAHRRRHQP